MRKIAVIAAVGLAFALSGCVTAEEPKGDATVMTTAPSNADKRCDLLTSDDLSQIFGVEFIGPTPTSASNQQQAECQWTAADQGAVVLVKVSDGGGKFLYRENIRAAEQNVGIVEQIKIKGAESAYALPRLGRIGMVVDDNYVEITALVPGASDEQISQLAASVAASAG